MTSPTSPGGAGDRAKRQRARDNGLPAEHFVELLDIDPRVVAPLLEALRLAGIAAYAEPSRGVVGGYLDVHLPERPTDRLWVDGARRAQAGEVVRQELAAQRDDPVISSDVPTEPPGSRGEAAGVGEAAAADPFEDLVAAFHEEWQVGADPPWPAAENITTGGTGTVASTTRVVRYPAPEPERDLPEHVEAYLDEHFVPEPPPPLPRPAVATFWALVGLVGGLGVLVGAGLLRWQLDPLVETAAGFGILGGFATLVWRMRDNHDDEPPDDGAVV